MFLTLVHIATGSTVEAAQADQVVGPFPTAEKAEAAGNKIHNAVKHIHTLDQELFCTVIEVPDEPVSANIAIAHLLDAWEDEDDEAGGVAPIEVQSGSVEDLMQHLMSGMTEAVGGALGGAPGGQVISVDLDEEDEPVAAPPGKPKTQAELDALVASMMDKEDGPREEPDDEPKPKTKLTPEDLAGGSFFGGQA